MANFFTSAHVAHAQVAHVAHDAHARAAGVAVYLKACSSIRGGDSSSCLERSGVRKSNGKLHKAGCSPTQRNKTKHVGGKNGNALKILANAPWNVFWG